MASPALMNNYGPRTFSFTHGEGAWLYDSEGNAYLDALTGIAVCGLGHSHPAVTQAICDQAQRLLHTSNLYNIERQEALADSLTRISGMEKVFFCNSGAEANEAAIKLARLHGHHQGIDTPMVIVMENAFHGRTMATLTATGNRKAQAGFEPLVSGFVRVPYNDIDAINRVAKRNSNIVAVLLEPVQGEGGIHIASDDYLNQLRAICDQQNWLMMLDEVQSGNGRSGHFFAYQAYDWLPDVVLTAKGLGNGVPIGACLARGNAAELFTPGTHGSTFGGNPLACAAASAVVATIEQEQLCQRAQDLGERLRHQLAERLAGCDEVVEIRGKGLLIGIEMKQPCTELVALATTEYKLLINVTQGNVIRLLPPLNLTDEQADQLIDRLISTIDGFLSTRDSAE